MCLGISDQRYECLFNNVQVTTELNKDMASIDIFSIIFLKSKGGNDLEQDGLGQTTVEGIDGGLYSAVDGQCLNEVMCERTMCHPPIPPPPPPNPHLQAPPTLQSTTNTSHSIPRAEATKEERKPKFK